MLQRIHVRNFALIDELDLVLNKGLTAITGETGSGKSILLSALGLVMGDRADLASLQNKTSKCIVEVSFEVTEQWRAFFESKDLDYEPISIVRREISPAGKSRAFINDTPCNLATLKEFSSKVLDIHSQSQTRLLTDRGFLFRLLDRVADQSQKVEEWRKTYRSWKSQILELNQLKEQEEKAVAELDFLSFQLNELEEAGLDEIKDQDIESELSILKNADEIKAALQSVAYALEESDQAIVAALRNLDQQLDAVSRSHGDSETLQLRIRSVAIELQDIAQESQNISDSMEQDPERLHDLQNIQDKLFHLMTKHRLNTTDDLLTLRSELQEKVGSIGSLEDRISQLQEKVSQAEGKLIADAKKIHAARVAAGNKLSKEILEELASLKLTDAKLLFDLKEEAQLNEYGCSVLQVMFSANKGSEPQLLEKAASGGERSRIMLALKAVIARHEQLPTMIFDEIDTGVSGDVASRMANSMYSISEDVQVIAITHLAQVAGRADHHIRVEKNPNEERTLTSAKVLSREERLEELAAMLSGSEITDSARSHASELLAH